MAANPQFANLHTYQRLMANFAIEHPKCGLFLPLGAGKTLTTLEVLYELDPHYHVLIIGPKTVIRSTWTTEIEKFNFPFRISSLIENEKGRPLSTADRHDLYQSIQDMTHAHIWLINRELVVDLVENLPKASNGTPIWPFKFVIIDEAQAFKTYNSKRFLALKRVSPQIHRMIELSGTPAPNGIQDIWPLIYLLDGGQRLGPNITQFRNTYMYPTIMANGVRTGWKPQAWAEPVINDLIKDIVVSLPDLRQNMPDLIMSDNLVYLSDKERKLYKELVAEQVLEFENGDSVEAVNAAVLQAKLSQLASGAIYVNGTSQYQKIHERKLEETYKIIDNAGSPVLIAYHFKSDREMLIEYLRERLDPKPKRGKKAKPRPDNDPTSAVQAFDGSPNMVKRWNEGKIPVMLVQPASAGHGLNLQYGGHTLVWYTLPWSLEHYLQTNGRLYRQGQANTVFIHRILCDKTVDTKIVRALSAKDMSEKALLEAIQATITEAE